MQMTRAALSTVVGIVLGVGLTACGSPEPAAPPSRTTTTAAPAPTTPAATTPTPTASTGNSAADRAKAALVRPDGYAGQGYEPGQDATPGSTSSDVCNKPLDIDRGGTATAGARQWTSPSYTVLNVVRAYPQGSAADAVRQIRSAAGTCTTYTLATETYTLGAPVTTTDYYGIDAAFTYCEQVAEHAQCTAYFGTGQKLATLRVRGRGTQSTSDVQAELHRLADAVAAAVQAS